MPDSKKYKMVLDTGGSLYSWPDERGNWICEIKGAAKWFAIVRNTEAIWVSCRKWDKLPETFEIESSAWNAFRQEVQKREEEKESEPKEEEEEGITEEIKAKAIAVLKTGKPVEFFLDTYNKIHVGDKDLGQILIYCTGSQLNKTSNGLHPKLSGESGMGKSDAVETFLHCLPKCAYIKTSMSSKAIFYHDIKPGTIIFLDDYKQNDDLDAIIKQTSSRFHEPYEHRTIDKDREAQIMLAPPEIVWAITSVDSSQDIQVLNRQVGLDVDGSEDQTKAVIAHLLKQAGTGEERFPITEEVLICRAMVLELKRHMFKIAIPYWDRIKWEDYSSRRNPSIFLDLVRANAVWNFMQRNAVDDDFIEASEQDFIDAKTLYVGRADTLIDKLSKSERKLAQAIVDAKGEMFREDAAKIMNVSVNRISQLIHGENGKTGLLQKLPGFNVESVTENEGERKVHKTRLYLDGYNKFDGFDTIVTLEPSKRYQAGQSKESKDGVSRQIYGETVSGNIDSYLVSKLEEVYMCKFLTLPSTNLKLQEKLISLIFPQNALLSLLRGQATHSSPYGVTYAKAPKANTIEEEMIKAMDRDAKEELRKKTPTEKESTFNRVMARLQKSGKEVQPIAARMSMAEAGYDLSAKEITEMMKRCT